MYIGVLMLQAFALVLIIWAIILLLSIDNTKMQQTMLCFMFMTLIQNAGYMLELLSTTAEASLMTIRMQYLGVGFLTIFFSQFIYYYCNRRPPRLPFEALSVGAICSVAAMWSCNYHNLFYKKMVFVEDGIYPHFEFQYGILHYTYLVICIIIPYLMALLILVQSIRNDFYLKRKAHYGQLIFLSLFPLTAMALRSSGILQEYDPNPAVLAIILSCVVISVWSRRNVDLSRMASASVLNTIDDGVILLDEEKLIVSFNPAMHIIFPVLDSKWLGARIEKLEGFPMEIFASDGKWEFSIEESRYDARIKRMTDTRGKLCGYVVCVMDVTATHNFIEEILETRKQAESANKAKSDFIANMSHEIRTPMNAIIGFSELIKEESHGRKMYDFACDIQHASQNLLKIVNDILDLSKIEAGRMELVEVEYGVRDMVSETLGIMRMAAVQHGLSLTLECDDKIPCKLRGDDIKIRQILINLLNNAIKFTRQGSVRLKVEQRPFREGWIFLIFEVQDTGIGIKEEDLHTIFDDFSQVDSKRNRNVEGTGLGLSISRKMIHLMRGTIRVDSVYGEGSTFTVTIPQQVCDERPLAEVPQTIKEEEMANAPMFKAEGYRILVVDDNLINRKVALGMLKQYCFDLAEAASGQEAIDMVKAEKYDMILMDHMMPDMDGVEATKIIRSQCGNNGRTPVIVALTANAMQGAKEMFLRNGFQDFLAKPIDKKLMHVMLTKWIPDRYKEVKETKEESSNQDITLDDLSDVFLNGITITEALKRHSGTLEEYMEILRLFYMDGKQKIQYLAELVEKKDWKNYRIEVHALKSAAANIAADRLSAEAKAHEDAAAAENVEFITQHSEELLEDYRNLLGEIRVVLKKKMDSEPDEPEVARREIETEELADRLEEALHLLETFKSKDCAEKVNELFTYRLPEKIEELLLQIQTKLKLYADDEAEDLLREAVAAINRIGGDGDA